MVASDLSINGRTGRRGILCAATRPHMNYLDRSSHLNLFLLLALLVAYALGGFNTGYWLVRWRTGQDLRTIGSGNAGARNVGRILGPWGFAATLLGDMLKGALPVLGVQLAGGSTIDGLLVGLAVTAGHNWPAQLGFRGGKGLATSFGALLMFNPLLAGTMLGLCGALLVLTRRFTLSATVPYALCPLFALWCGYHEAIAALLVPIVAVVVLPHLPNLCDELHRDQTTTHS